MKKYILIIIVDGDEVEEVMSFGTEKERGSFSHGLSYGANLYGGSSYGCEWPSDGTKEDSPEIYKKIVAYMKLHDIKLKDD